MPPKTNPTLQIDADMDKVRLSHILQWKTLFREHPGPSAVEIVFRSQSKPMYRICIDAAWGVQIDETFVEKLKILSQKNSFTSHFGPIK